jgi:hypothetical protein
VDLYDFFETRGGKFQFPRWYNSFTLGRKAPTGKAWGPADNSFLLRIERGNDDIRNAVLVQADREGFMNAAYRIRNGVEEEFRPMYYPSRLPLSEYDKVNFLRAPKNFSFTNVNLYEARYLLDGDLSSRYGVRWGSDFTGIVKAFERRFQLQNPQMFFSESRFGFINEGGITKRDIWRKHPGVWFLPEWILSFNDSVSTQGAWSPRNDLSRTFYLFLRDDQKEVRIVEVQQGAGLSAIYEFTSNGLMAVTRPKKRESLAGGDVPFASEVLQNLRGPSPAGVSAVRSSLPEIAWGGPPPSRWRGTMTAVDPYTFFRTRGHAFARWMQQFFNSAGQGGYAFLPDNSWQDSRRHKYFVIAEPLWSLWKIQAAKPSWCVLEYAPRRGTFALVGINHYDESWNETRLKPPPTPSLLEIPPLESWEEENAGKVKAIKYKVAGVVIVGIMALLTSYLRRRRQREFSARRPPRP